MRDRFSDPRIATLAAEGKLMDDNMRRTFIETLEVGEVARAAYSVGAHYWLEAVLTDRALLFIKGAVKPKVVRIALPVEVVRPSSLGKKGTRIETPFGVKTLWGSTLDPDTSKLTAEPTFSGDHPDGLSQPGLDFGLIDVGDCVRRTASEDVVTLKIIGPDSARTNDESGGADGTTGRRSWRQRRVARRAAGRKPRKPKRQRARMERVGFPPSSTIWDISHSCVKCGRVLTNPDSQRHRVGTDCIKWYGSQARKIANPAYDAWTSRKARAEVNRAVEQATLDAEYNRQRTSYVEALERWSQVRAGRV
ncbi:MULTISPECIES: hypothetical protein [unclassified Nocardioides]|uniref:hypothetical protein n=1 Tax=unclassified Nocardioides TaxID=2615069 RepID=UPI0007027970|nr:MULTISPECIES: hypothetical protein [unclassified Nocardioides]KRC53364.1 hypothetical protein ASE19_13515 [Nocardioides sp. Root79]KRC70701.1 hypothetical protein ASE20_12360 [Nocardioides sp. Root240]